MIGTLALELGNLEELVALDLRKCNEQLPACVECILDGTRTHSQPFFGLTLFRLYLASISRYADNNSVAGSLPTELGQLEELQFLDLCTYLLNTTTTAVE